VCLREREGAGRPEPMLRATTVISIHNMYKASTTYSVDSSLGSSIVIRIGIDPVVHLLELGCVRPGYAAGDSHDNRFRNS
jgi:hypothetical protein